MSDILRAENVNIKVKTLNAEIKRELIRKSFHLLIGLVPTLASLNYGLTVTLLIAGILVYSYCEFLRLNNFEVIIVSKITNIAARKRDQGKFVLGPVTLGIGALLALSLYPEPAAAIAIYALAFGDGLSSLVGKAFGSIRIPFTKGKSIEGSLTCFTAVLCSSYSLTKNLSKSLIIAFVATITEAIPTKDIDNILLPFITGLVAVFLF